MSWLKNKYKEIKTEYKQKSAANKLIKKKANVAYLQEREKQQIKLARQKAQYERKQEYKRYSAPKTSMGGGVSLSNIFMSSSGGSNSIPDIMGTSKKGRKNKQDIFNFDI